MKKNNSVLCIIVSYNGVDKLAKTVKALINQVEEILIIDNGSNKETLALISSMQEELNIKSILLESNYGIGVALNKGVVHAQKLGFEWILTMDQDSVANEDMVEELLSSAHRQSKLCAVSPMIFEKKEKDEMHDKIIEYSITSGNLVPTSIFNIIGLYNEDYFIDSVDFEFCLRIKNSGVLLIQSGRAKLNHELGNEVKKKILGYDVNYIQHSPQRRYYIYRNHLYISRAYFLTNQLFIIKKTIYLLFYTLNILIFDDKKIENLKLIYLGISDYFRGALGPIKITGSKSFE